jgi:ATP-dependent protease ClpP protease subunit
VEIDLASLLGGLVPSKKPRLGFPFGGKGSCNIYSIDNNIYFQNDIDYDSISELNREMREMQASLLEMSRSYRIPSPPIRLHLTTHGGSVHAALSAIDCMRELEVEVHTVVDGYVASAGTLISVCGKKRYMKQNATMLIHELRSEVWGKMSELEEQISNLRKMSDTIRKIYEENTRIPRRDLNKILLRDIDMDAQTCLNKGLIDEIL